jgi:long-chain acyl-CoA synthetase
LAPVVQGEGKDQRFIAIWAKNREEWTMTLLAGMKVRTTVFGFYDAQGPESVNMIVEQTELSTIFCSADFVKKIADMIRTGTAKTIRNVVSFDKVSEADKLDA